MVAEGFTCEVEEGYRSACKRLDSYGEHEGKRYCVLHFPSEEKKDDFRRVLESKLAQIDYDFGGAIFPEGTSNFERYEFDVNTRFVGASFREEANFVGARFSGVGTSFHKAQFSGENTYFSGAEFSGELTDFTGAKFNARRTDFTGAKFNGKATVFAHTTFSGELIDFSGAEFSGQETKFLNATFLKNVRFLEVTFREKVLFVGTKANSVFDSEGWIVFDHARIDKPELLTFKTVLLRPAWFINMDVRKVEFFNVKWFGMPSGFDEEIDALKANRLTTLRDAEERDVIERAYSLLAQACRRLSANAEENREYQLANEFHYWSMEADRKKHRASAFAWWTLIWWYWLLSGYGEREKRALMWLVGIWVGFAGLYMWVGPVGIEKQSLAGFPQAASEALVYSLGVMTRLANAIPKSASTLAEALIIIEGVLGPLQIGLFLLALRRKFMR